MRVEDYGMTKYVYYDNHAERYKAIRESDLYPDEIHYAGNVIKRVKPLDELTREDFPEGLRGRLPLELAARDVSVREALRDLYE